MSNNISTTGNGCTLNPISSCSSVSILNDDALHHLISFLDFKSVKKFRLVCSRWAVLVIPHLNSRGYFSIARNNYAAVDTFTDTNLDFKQASSKYSSLEFDLNYLLSAYPLQINEVEAWKNVKSLQITLELSREHILWIYKLISSSSNLSQLTLIFCLEDSTHPAYEEVDSDSHLAVNNTRNECFPQLPEYPQLKSLTFQTIHNYATSYLASHLISSCVNLRRLTFKDCDYTHFDDPEIDENCRFILFERLIRTPLRKLESFRIDMARAPIEVEPGSRREPSYNSEENEFVHNLRDLQEKFQLPFGNNIRSIAWHVPFAREVNSKTYQLLPGILTKSVASSLVKLQLDCALYDFDKDCYTSTVDYPKCLPISFPSFDNLVELILGNHTCYTLSLSDFVDAGPNLQLLVIRGPNCHTLLHEMGKSGRLKMMEMLWRETSRSSNLPHNKLRELTIDMPIEDMFTLSKFTRKFPKLEQLDVGNVSSESMDEFLGFISTELPALKRMFWAYEERELTLQDLFDHVGRIPTLLPNLEHYFLKRYQGFADKAWEEDFRKFLCGLLTIKHHKRLLPSIILHVQKFVCCHKEKDSQVCPKNCKQSRIHSFIQRHRLPIQIRAHKEYEGACRVKTDILVTTL
jgi:hypothetical protein